MKAKIRSRIFTLLITFACVLIVTCSCSMPGLQEGKPSSIMSISETTGFAVSEPFPTATPAAAPLVTVAPIPTVIPTPTPTPAPKPTAAPTPVHIPREELPDGRLLEDGYYAVIPGEGAYYNVFDSYGKLVSSFLFTDAESQKPTGIYTEESLSVYCHLNRDNVQLVVPEKPDEYNCTLKSNENGFYQIDYTNTRVFLYNTEGEHIRTLSYSVSQNYYVGWGEIVVACNDGETIVSFQSTKWNEVSGTTSFSNTIYFVSNDGTVNNTCRINDLPGKPVGLLGRKYFIAYGAEYGHTHCNIYDFSGSLIKEGVIVLNDSYFTICTSEAVTYICISDYYKQNGRIYDSSFTQVDKNAVEPDGDLIYGTEYDVEGIPCTAYYREQGGSDYYSYLLNEFNELVAVGTADNKIAVKTNDGEYVFDNVGLKYYGINNHVLVLGPEIGDKYMVISLETGELLYTIDKYDQIQIAHEYILVSRGEYYPPYGKYPDTFIIDKDGNVRFASTQAYAQCTSGEYIILHRGPYIGIADLNGDWILKSLDWELTRDEEYHYPWE